MIERRDFLRAMLVAAAGPMIVRASSLMPIRALAPEWPVTFPDSFQHRVPTVRWVVTAVTSSDGVPTGMRALDSGMVDWTGGLTFTTSPGFNVGDIIECYAPLRDGSGALEAGIKIT